MYDIAPLCEALGITPSIKILSFFMAHQHSDYTKTDVAENTKMSRQTVYKGMKSLERFEIVILSRQIGYSKLYKLNLESNVVKASFELNEAIVKRIVIEEISKPTPESASLEDVKKHLQK